MSLGQTVLDPKITNHLVKKLFVGQIILQQNIFNNLMEQMSIVQMFLAKSYLTIW